MLEWIHKTIKKEYEEDIYSDYKAFLKGKFPFLP